MPPRRDLVVLLCALLSSTPVWGTPTPRIAVINRDGALVRSGPGKEYYAADALRKGDRLEVYRVEEGGWCAVRPPAGSFSRVLADHLLMTETPNVAEVMGDKVRAYVGSRVRERRDVVQVLLNRGELVEVVGEEELTNPETGVSQTWYRIVPPAGEYRWVHLEFVNSERKTVAAQRAELAASRPATPAAPPGEQRPTAADMAATTNGGTTQGPAASSPNSSPNPLREGYTSSAAALNGPPISGITNWKPLPPGTLEKRAEYLAAKMEEPKPKIAEPVAPPPNQQEGIRVVENFSSREPPPRIIGPHDASPIPADALESVLAGADKASRVIAASATGNAPSLEEELAELDVKFSLMVAKPSTQWQLEPLMLRAQKIAESATTPQVHGKARELLEKMVQFARLQPGASPLGQVLSPTGAYDSGRPVPATNTGPVAVPAAAGGAGGLPPNQSRNGLPSIMNAIDSLMPAPPQPNNSYLQRAGSPPANAVAAGQPLLQAVSAQTPETAPPDPAGLAWGTATEPMVRLPHSATDPGSAVGTGVTASAPSPWQTTRANATQVAANTPAPSGTDGVFDRVKDTLLYPFGGGTISSNAGNVDTTAYDGRGWLVPVVSRKGRSFAQTNYMPPFALTDAQGNVLEFVTPAPGVNLHRYLKQEIGIFGQQRPLDHLTKPHVTASRVVMLDRHRR